MLFERNNRLAFQNTLNMNLSALLYKHLFNTYHVPGTLIGAKHTKTGSLFPELKKLTEKIQFNMC